MQSCGLFFSKFFKRFETRLFVLFVCLFVLNNREIGNVFFLLYSNCLEQWISLTTLEKFFHHLQVQMLLSPSYFL
jgi:hypothetical protein